MKLFLPLTSIALLAVAGCAQGPAGDPDPGPLKLTTTSVPAQNSSAAASHSSSAAPSNQNSSAGDRIVARVAGQPITYQQFIDPLIEAHGLQMLMGLVQLDLVKQDARAGHLTVTPGDIQHEYDLTLEKMFKDANQKEQDQLDVAESKGQTELAQKLRAQIRSDREQLLSQFLEERHYTRIEFDLKVQINAYLRKLAEPLLAGKITDDMVEKEFGIEYGETAQVRYIQLVNMQEVNEARRRLKAGEDFAEVAKSMSHNPRNAPLGGELGTFSRQTPGLPDEFKQLAFSLSPGQVSDTLNLSGNFYIIKMEQKFPPKAVKFASVKDSLRKSMYDRVTQSTMEQLDLALGREVIPNLKIEDPQLKKLFDDYQAKQQSTTEQRKKMESDFRKQRLLEQMLSQTRPATQPATTTTSPATQP